MLLTVYRATFTVTRGHVLTHSLPKENICQIVALYAKQEYRSVKAHAFKFIVLE